MKNIIDKLKNNKKMTILTISLLVVIGVSLAFVAPIIMDGASNNTDIIADSVDQLNFSVNKEITLNVTQLNLVEGGDNLTNTAIGTASLLANSTDNTASYIYYVYFNVLNNEYIYTTEDKKPEIILTITDPNGIKVTSLDGLTYNETLQGFDITTKKGMIQVADKYGITSNSSTVPTEQDWTFTISFINLETNQKDNSNKELKAEIIMCEKLYLNNYIRTTYVNNDAGQTLLYHDNSLENGAGDFSFRYSGSSDIVNNYVCFGTDAIPCPVDNLYRIIGVFDDGTRTFNIKLIKYDYTTSAQLGENGDYNGLYTFTSNKYKGNNFENIVYFYWNASTENGGTQSSIWSESRLNTINLNTNYLNYLGEIWTKKIVDTTWQVGGGSKTYFYDIPSIAYSYELGVNSLNITYRAKIGLMYVSDYGFAASQDSWTIPLRTDSGADYKTVTQNNWMHMGLNEWTITKASSGRIFYIDESGYESNYNVFYHYAARPAFYLSPSIEYISGIGTATEPYRII